MDAAGIHPDTAVAAQQLQPDPVRPLGMRCAIEHRRNVWDVVQHTGFVQDADGEAWVGALPVVKTALDQQGLHGSIPVRPDDRRDGWNRPDGRRRPCGHSRRGRGRTLGHRNIVQREQRWRTGFQTARPHGIKPVQSTGDPQLATGFERRLGHSARYRTHTKLMQTGRHSLCEI